MTRSPLPPTSCVVGGTLMEITHPGRLVVAAVLGLAGDGYIDVAADEHGYTVSRGPADPAGLWPDRAVVLAGLFDGADEVRLERPDRPPQVAPRGPISGDRLSTGLTRSLERYGFV